MEFYSGFIAVFVSGFCNKDEYVSSGVDSLETKPQQTLAN